MYEVRYETLWRNDTDSNHVNLSEESVVVCLFVFVGGRQRTIRVHPYFKNRDHPNYLARVQEEKISGYH